MKAAVQSQPAQKMETNANLRHALFVCYIPAVGWKLNQTNHVMTNDLSAV
jgi:hypothetical protein